MGKQIKLPGGVLFDPETGEIQGGNFGHPPTAVRGLSQSARHNIYRQSYNLWDRFNDFISEIGDWIAIHSEMITNYCGLGLFVLSWIGFALAIISIWMSEGFIWALLAGVIGGGIFYYVSMILLGIFIFVMNIVLAIIRYLFYNAYTFLIPILLVIVLCFSSRIDILQNRTTSVSNSVVSLQPNYYCDVNTTLNVREYPRANAQVIGQLKRNEEIYVYSVDNNFAKIDFKGRIAYVSNNYLKPKTTQVTNTENTQTTELIGTKFTGYDDQRALMDKLGFWSGDRLFYGDGKFAIEKWENKKEQPLWLVLIEKVNDKGSIIRDILPFERKSIGDIGTFPVFNKNTEQWSDYMMVQITDKDELVRIYDVDLRTGKILAKNPESYWGEVRTEWDSY
jgi:hypothetical protein